MSDLANQAAFDALRVSAQEPRYDDGTATEAQANIVMPDNSYFSTPFLTMRDAGETFSTDRSIIVFDRALNQIGGGDVANGAWANGNFTHTNGTLYFATTSTIEWPGFPTTTERAVINLMNTTLIAPDSSSAAWQFPRISPNSNISGVTIRNGGFIWPVGYSSLVGLALSADTVADAASPTGRVQWRINGHADPLDARWDGWFDCDFSNWTNTNTGGDPDFTFSLASGTGGAFSHTDTPWFFVVDGTFSAAKRAAGAGLNLANARPGPKRFTSYSSSRKWYSICRYNYK